MTDTVEVDRELLEQIEHLLTKDGVYSEPVQSVVRDIGECLDEDEDSIDATGFYHNELDEIYMDLTDRRNRLDEVINLIKHIENDIRAIEYDTSSVSVVKNVNNRYIEIAITIQAPRPSDEIDNLLTIDKIDGVSIRKKDLEYKMDNEMNHLQWDITANISLRP